MVPKYLRKKVTDALKKNIFLLGEFIAMFIIFPYSCFCGHFLSAHQKLTEDANRKYI